MFEACRHQMRVSAQDGCMIPPQWSVAHEAEVGAVSSSIFMQVRHYSNASS